MQTFTFTCDAGSFQGVAHDEVIDIKGIRYATSDRYAQPKPYVYNAGLHLMSKDAPFALQMPSTTESLLQGTHYELLYQEESCQYLSITLPLYNDSARRLPVMVWLHGGAYRNGGCDGPAYDRTLLAKEGNLIVIGMNYRLGVLGFGKDLDGSPSNNGLLDVLEGLRWVQQNISSFGGDPHNITLFGQSAGADLARCVMLSENTANLYTRVILQSDPIGAMEERSSIERFVTMESNKIPQNASSDMAAQIQTRLKPS
ncbi:MAG: carboxylesterase family protein [Atopobiaceae bacterium]|jgi:para-nitrobenzyl esterase